MHFGLFRGIGCGPVKRFQPELDMVKRGKDRRIPR